MFSVIAGLLVLALGAGVPSALSVRDGSYQDQLGIVRFEIDGVGVYATDYQLERFASIRGFDDADLWPVGDPKAARNGFA